MVLIETLLDEVLGLEREVAEARIQEFVYVLVQDSMENLVDVVSWERQPPRQTHVHDDTCGPDVARWCDKAIDDLGCNVERRTADERLLILAHLEVLGQSKVDQLNIRQVVCALQHDVLEPDVAVANTLRAQVVERA